MLTVKEAAAELGVTVSRVHALMDADRLRYKKVGSVYLVYRDRLFYAKRKPGRPRKVAT